MHSNEEYFDNLTPMTTDDYNYNQHSIKLIGLYFIFYQIWLENYHDCGNLYKMISINIVFFFRLWSNINFKVYTNRSVLIPQAATL